MKKTLAALAISFTLGLAFSAVASTRATPTAEQDNSCKASGHACDKAEECCSRMCRKDNGKCG